MSRMGMWTQIPNDSWVKVWVEGKPDDKERPFVAQGIFHLSDAKSGDDPLPDLDLKPRRRKLSAPENYSITVTIDFADKSTAIVIAEVTNSKGNPLPEVFSGGKPQFRSSEVVAKGLDSQTVTLMLVTKSGAGGNLK